MADTRASLDPYFLKAELNESVPFFIISSRVLNNGDVSSSMNILNL